MQRRRSCAQRLQAATRPQFPRGLTQSERYGKGLGAGKSIVAPVRVGTGLKNQDTCRFAPLRNEPRHQMRLALRRIEPHDSSINSQSRVALIAAIRCDGGWVPSVHGNYQEVAANFIVIH